MSKGSPNVSPEVEETDASGEATFFERLQAMMAIQTQKIQATFSSQLEAMEDALKEKDDRIEALEAKSSTGDSGQKDIQWKRTGHKVQYSFNSEVISLVQQVLWALEHDKVEHAREEATEAIKKLQVKDLRSYCDIFAYVL